jgi:hypothetical protein
MTMESHPALLIADVMPRYSLRQVDRVAVAAEPSHAYAVARNVDMYRIPFVRWLFQLRTLPERIAAWVRGKPYNPNLSSRIEDIARAGSGFLVLREEPGREVVIGSVGKFWQLAIEFAPVTPDTFTAFERPGYGKLAWCIRVDPRVGGGSWLTVELRVGATDAASLARFKRYWWLIGRFSHAIRHGVMRMLVKELGAAPADATRLLPGDALLPRSLFQRTHATTIDAPVEHVWPWLVQMGARRAGWYSFDLLDNGRVPSADYIIPELQSLSVGDIIPALPKSPDGFAVLSLDAPRSLVLGDPSLLPGGRRPKAAPPWKTTWAFVLEPIGGVATRLTVRVRAEYAPSLKMAVVLPVMRLAHEVMERRQLHNLRRRAQAMEAP